jgi:hypothetical protein
MEAMMAEQEQGHVSNVYIEPAGDETAATSLSGTSTLTLYDVADFSESGGQLQVNGLVYSYLTIDDVNATITLATTLSADVLVDTAVYHYPLAEEKWAMVQLSDEEDVILARIPHTMHDRFTDGIRPDDEQESVFITPEGGVWTVLDVIAKVPEIEENYLGSDGFPPTISPTPEAFGTVGAILLRWVPLSNADPVTYDVHMSTSTGFAVSGANLIVEDETGSAVTITKNPDGSDLVPATNYYFRVVVKDEDGAAAASSEVSAQTKQATNAEISAAFAYLGQIYVNQLLGGTLNADVLLASLISNRGGGAGAGVDIDPTGISIYDSLGVPATLLQPDLSKFKGAGEFDSLTVTGPGTFRDTTEIAQSAEVILRSATTAPVAPPSIIVGWPHVETYDKLSGGYGLYWDGSEWNTVKEGVDAFGYVFPVVKRSGASPDVILGTPTGMHPWGGLTRIGTNWYVFGWRNDEFSGYTWYITQYDSSGVQQSQVAYTPLDAAFGSGADFSAGLGVGAIGTDDTNILIAEFDDANNRFRIQTRNATTLAVSATLNTAANAGFTGPVVGIQRGSFDLGATRSIILSKNAGHHWPFDTSGVYQVNEAYPSPVPGTMSGFDWDGTRFWSTRAKHVATDASIIKHSTYKWLAADLRPHYTTSTWRDTDSTGGTHQTDMGPVATFAMKKRAWVTLTSPVIPDLGGTDDPNAVSFFLGDVNATRTNLWQQTLPGDGINGILIGDSIVLSGTNPPATNDFPGSTPAVMRNDDFTLVISADGSVDALNYYENGQPFYRPILIRKSADQTILNSVVVQQDTHLRFDAVANGVYFISVMALVNQSANATGMDIQLGFSVPAGASWSGGGPGPDVSIGTTASGSGDWSGVIGSGATMLPYGLDGNADQPTIIPFFATLVMGGTAGTVIFTWSQLNLTNVTLRMKVGSFLRAERIS